MSEQEFEYRSFDGEELLGFFEEVDSGLASESLDQPYHIVIVGGAAIALQLPERMTGDVDVVSEGMPAALRRVVEGVAQPHGLRPDWINSAAKFKTVSIAAEPEPVFTGKYLVVEAAGPRYLLAMKLVSARPIDRVDCVYLVRKLGIKHVDELLDLVESAVPWDSHRTVTTRYFAEEILAEANQSGNPPRRSFWQALRNLRSRRKKPSPRSARRLPKSRPYKSRTSGRCGKSMPRAKKRCVLPIGHAGPCRF